MTSNAVLLNVKPRIRVSQPSAVDTYGDLAGDFAADYGLRPDPWQRGVLDDWLAVDELEQWSSLTCGLSCPRQNGKNGILEIRELFGMVGRGEKILHTAHEVKTARKAFKRLQHFFGVEKNDPGAKFPELNARVVELRNVNGQEAIFLDNGGSVEIVARSKNSGRGFTADVLVCDEAQEMSDEDLEALMPTTSAAPLGNPQWIFTGTPPGPKANGEVFTRTRTDALSEHPYRICWNEWSACDPGDIHTVNLDDCDVWSQTNPALGGRLLLPVVEGERARYSDEGFARERLGVWEKPPESKAHSGPIDLDRFAKLAQINVDYDRSTAVLAVDVAYDRSWTSVGAVGMRGDGLTQCKLVALKPGTTWAPERIKELCDELGGAPIVMAKDEPLIDAVEALGVAVVQMSGAEQARASQKFIDACSGEAPTLRHRGEPALIEALRIAVPKAYGDGNTDFGRRLSPGDISPLKALTMCYGRLGAEEEEPVDRRVFMFQ